MATQRVELTVSFQQEQVVWVATSSGQPTNQSYTILIPVIGANVTITNRGTGTPATVFAAATGGATISSLQTDGGGNVPGWVVEGSYTVTAGAVTGFTGASVAWEAVRGDGVENIYPGAVTSSSIATGTIQTTNLTTPLQSAIYLPGDIITSAASSRAGALICNGAAVSRTTYSALFGAIGITYGVGDGSTTFNVPDFRGRTLIGAGTGVGLTGRSRGQTGGEEFHTLIENEMPAHYHSGNTGYANTQHTHSVFSNIDGADFNNMLPLSGDAWMLVSTDGGGACYANLQNPPNYVSAGATGNTNYEDVGHFHPIPIDGGNFAHNTMQPFGVTNYFIKT